MSCCFKNSMLRGWSQGESTSLRLRSGRRWVLKAGVWSGASKLRGSFVGSPRLSPGTPLPQDDKTPPMTRIEWRDSSREGVYCYLPHSPLDLRRGKNLNIKGGIEWERRNHGSLS